MAEQRIYVTSDLHGYPLEKFKDLLCKAKFRNEDYCFVLGDVIDRGPDGVKILQWLMDQPNIQLILGNHEAMLLACKSMIEKKMSGREDELNSQEMMICANWLQNGGTSTLEALMKLDAEEIGYIIEFLEEAPLYDGVSIGDKEYILTHSGFDNFDKDRDLDDYKADELLWNRPDISDEYFDDAITVFGHTPTMYYGEEYEGRMLVTDTWIDIDTGAATDGGSPMLLRLNDMKEFYAED